MSGHGLPEPQLPLRESQSWVGVQPGVLDVLPHMSLSSPQRMLFSNSPEQTSFLILQIPLCIVRILPLVFGPHQ